MKERQALSSQTITDCQILLMKKNSLLWQTTTECNDQHQLIPMLLKTEENVGSPDKAKAS
jgi:hypothetical protein